MLPSQLGLVRRKYGWFTEGFDLDLKEASSHFFSWVSHDSRSDASKSKRASAQAEGRQGA
jgi:hypothetical protein